ncbi:helix-turn-helix transcriptional regulator [Pedobacter fastidiosus]|uniref:Helix-turn-helix transcriptional regulator n=1 Tax=Pedobacter fastidiosus TaxID=2765361 RepID=A0ABR7KV14_9SPHI|nr:helix-turn-helix transcriptional regulator [Pedobacter fastidiosus]MBC6111941.1 helix-turn-helix transcriptional regulator [Pedobacter fastidiosus]
MDDLELFKKKLGKRIAQLREEKGLTQPNLGASINKDFQSISRIENGHVNASGYVLKQIADALNVSMNDIFDFDSIIK